MSCSYRSCLLYVRQLLLNLTKTDVKKLEQLQRNVCRQFQCLPERTSSIAVYALTGAEPIEVTLDKYCDHLV
jgi:hypothetical protein